MHTAVQCHLERSALEALEDLERFVRKRLFEILKLNSRFQA